MPILSISKSGPHTVPHDFRHERIPAGPCDLIVESTCLACGYVFISDLKLELLAAKQQAHRANCSLSFDRQDGPTAA